MAHSYYADLHSHSTASDGKDRPSAVVDRAKEVGLKVLALTDHDTVGGIEEAREQAKKYGIKIIAGTELSSYTEDGKGIHILGLDIDINNEALLAHCKEFQEKRIERANSIARALEKLGVPIDIDKVLEKTEDGVVGRPHIADALLEAGHIRTKQEAFDKYLAEGKPAYIPKMNVSPAKCVALIKGAGGVAIMAHPVLNDRIKYIPEVVAAGAAGIEVWHSSHSQYESDKLEAIAHERNLQMTGGSDCHGVGKDGGPFLGKYGMTKDRWEKFERFLSSR